MANARNSFIEVVKAQFNDPELKEKCRNYSIDKIQRGTANRAFDKLPQLIDNDRFAVRCKKALILIKQLKTNSEIEYKISQENKNAVKGYVKAIALIAREELLDSNYKIKNSIITLFGWEKVQKQLTNRALMSAFISAFNSQVLDHIKKEISETEFMAFSNEVNQHLSVCIGEALTPPLVTTKNAVAAGTALALLGLSFVAGRKLLGKESSTTTTTTTLTKSNSFS